MVDLDSLETLRDTELPAVPASLVAQRQGLRSEQPVVNYSGHGTPPKQQEQGCEETTTAWPHHRVQRSR